MKYIVTQIYKDKLGFKVFKMEKDYLLKNMAIYIDDLSGESLPVELNNPKDGESLIWSEEIGAYVNAPGGSASTEQIQDTVADMLEVDPDGTQVSLRLVSSYDDVTGKITFNVVSDGGGAGKRDSGAWQFTECTRTVRS